MNRQQRRRGGKPSNMSYAEQLARTKAFREAAQLAATDIAVEIKTDIATQKSQWLMMLALNDEFQFGRGRYERLANALIERSEWFEQMVKGADEEYATEKLRQEIERITHEEVELVWDDEIAASHKRHENDMITRYEQLRFCKPDKLAAKLCNWIDCQKCPGRELCSHTEGKANGLVKWMKEEVSVHGND